MRKNFHVSQLYMADNNIGDYGVEMFLRELGEIRSVRCLDISRTGLYDKWAKRACLWLRANNKVRIFKIAGNKIGDSGGKEIGLTLTGGHSLQHLDIGDCSIPAKRMKVIFEGIQKNSSLREILFEKNQVDRKALVDLVKAIDENRKLVKYGVGGLGLGRGLSEVIAAFKTNRVVSSIDFSNTSEFKGNGPLVQELAGMIRGHQSLSELTLTGCPFDQDGFFFFFFFFFFLSPSPPPRPQHSRHRLPRMQRSPKTHPPRRSCSRNQTRLNITTHTYTHMAHIHTFIHTSVHTYTY